MEGVQHAAADAKVDELRMFGLARQGLTCWMDGGWWWFSCVCCKKGRLAKVSETEMRVESEKLLMFVLTFMTNFQCIPSPSFSFPSNAFLSADEISIIGHNKRRWRDRVPEVSFRVFYMFFILPFGGVNSGLWFVCTLSGLIIFFQECLPLSPYVLLIGLLMNGRLHLLTSLLPRYLARA